MRKLAIAAIAATSAAFVALADDPTPIGTLVLEENFADYAKIEDGTITIESNSITPLTATSDLTTAMGTSVDAKITAATNAMDTAVDTALAGKKDKQTAVTDPTANGTGVTFIATASQDANGEITVTKKTVQDASTSQKGIVKLSSATNSTAEDLAATPKAVKAAYDLANGKQSPATTLAGYGITDAKIDAGTITLGANTITPLVGTSDLTTTMGTSVDTKITAATNALETANATALAGKKDKQTAVTDPTASGTSVTFIATASQDANGEITVTKKTVQDASTSQKGIVKLSSAVDSTSETLAATAKAVKTVKDAADAKVPLSNVKVDGTAITSSTVVELGNAYIVVTTTGTGANTKRSAALYARQ